MRFAVTTGARPVVRLSAVLMLLASLLAGPAPRAADLTLLVGNSPPQNHIINGEPVGMAVDIVKALLARAGLQGEYVQYPWARAYTLAQDAADHCIFSLARFPEREALFHWIGTVAFNEWAFFALAEKKLQLTSLEGARALRIGGQRNDAKIVWLEANGFQIDYSKSEDQALQKLLAGRIDVYPANVLARPVIAEKLGRRQDGIVPLYTYHKVRNYIACNLNSDPAKISRLRQAYASLEQDGSLEKIWQRHAELTRNR